MVVFVRLSVGCNRTFRQQLIQYRHKDLFVELCVGTHLAGHCLTPPTLSERRWYANRRTRTGP